MKKLLILLLLSTSFSTFALDLDNYFKAFCYESPKVQTRNGVWYLPNEQEPFTGENICVYKSNGQYHSQGEVLNGLGDGKWTWWFENGQMWSEANYKDGKMDGKYIWWYENGQIAAEQDFINGKLDGKDTRWHENGTVWYVGKFKNGKSYGKMTWWYDNGQIRKEKYFKDGECISGDC
jgi:antitoxin component YwqK of YwqJK toxin-antitoxin module